jgi:predicted nucleic acid-binding protein
VAANRERYVISDLASAEFASAIARRVRTRELTLEQARQDLADFDLWSIRSAQRGDIRAADVAVATTFLRRLDLPFLTPDAIHIAAARRLGATLVTFDRQMAANARALDVAVAEP